MALFAGYNAKVTLDGHTFPVREWSVRVYGDEFDATYASSSNADGVSYTDTFVTNVTAEVRLSGLYDDDVDPFRNVFKTIGGFSGADYGVVSLAVYPYRTLSGSNNQFFFNNVVILQCTTGASVRGLTTFEIVAKSKGSFQLPTY